MQGEEALDRILTFRDIIGEDSSAQIIACDTHIDEASALRMGTQRASEITGCADGTFLHRGPFLSDVLQ